MMMIKRNRIPRPCRVCRKEETPQANKAASTGIKRYVINELVVIQPTRSASADPSIHRLLYQPIAAQCERERGVFFREGANQSVAHKALCLMIINSRLFFFLFQ